MISNQFWYDPSLEDNHKVLWATVKILRERCRPQHMKMLEYYRLYGDQNALSPSGLTVRDLFRQSSWTNRVAWNVVALCIDTLVSKIGRRLPLPQYVPSGGRIQNKIKSKLLGKYIKGVFKTQEVKKIARRIFRDACIVGTGCVKVCSTDDKLSIRRILPLEILVDEAESLTDPPRQLFHVYPVSRDVLLEQYPDMAHAISNAAPSVFDKMFTRNTDRIDVAEAWYLPPGPGTPGRHTVALEGGTLLDEDYENEEFPILFFRYKTRSIGFWGQGIGEVLEGLQMEIIKILYRIQRSVHQLGSPWLMLPRDGEVTKPVAGDGTVQIIRFLRNIPKVVHPQPLDPQLLNLLNLYYQKAFELVGVSQMSAMSRKEPGITAGIAIRETQDIETERFAELETDFNEFSLEIAKAVTNVVEYLAEEGNDEPIQVKQHKDFALVEWKDINLDKDQYVIEVYPTSFLPSTPSGRKQTVQEMIKAGMIDPKEGMQLLDFPDLEAFQDAEFATRDVAKKLIERIADEGVYTSPEAFDDLAFCYKYAIQVYNECRLRIEIYPEEHLDLLRQYIAEVEQLIKQTQQPQQQQPQQQQPTGEMQ